MFSSLWQSISTSDSQAKPPAPPLWLNEVWTLVGQAFSLPDFCHRLLAAQMSHHKSSHAGQPTRRAFMMAPLLAFALRGEGFQDDWQGIKRVVAVGDLHGDCDALIAVLKMAKLVDDRADWNGGESHLVQLGDLPSRGGQSREALDLLAKLEKQASTAGGHVHALIGNHEAMVMSGDYRSILPEEFARFRTANSEASLKVLFDQAVAERKQHGWSPKSDQDLEDFKRKWYEYHVPGFAEYKQAFSPDGQYGKWIRSHNVVVRINDVLYSHGGISPEFVSTPIATVNQTVRTELADPSKFPSGMITNFESPVWYRGLAEGDERQLANHVRTVLRTFGVKRIVIGHTVTRSVIMPRFHSTVVDIDIGLSKFYGRPPACLVSENGSTFVLHGGVKIPFPGPTKQDLIAYLRAVAAADKEPAVIQKVIDRVNSTMSGNVPRGGRQPGVPAISSRLAFLGGAARIRPQTGG
jgi:hypothetical protein